MNVAEKTAWLLNMSRQMRTELQVKARFGKLLDSPWGSGQFASCHSLQCFSVQIKHKIYKHMSSAQQQRERRHWKVLIESFHLSGHTFSLDGSGFQLKFSWLSQIRLWQ